MALTCRPRGRVSLPVKKNERLDLQGVLKHISLFSCTWIQYLLVNWSDYMNGDWIISKYDSMGNQFVFLLRGCFVIISGHS